MTHEPGEIWILTDWPVAAAGVRAIIADDRSFRSDVTVLGASAELDEKMSGRQPDILIADPRLLSAERCDEMRSEGVTLFALGLHPVPHSVTERYSSVIQMSDRPSEICSRVKKALAERTDAVSPRGSELSPREKEVVCGIVKGLANKEIAVEMNVSVNTIMTHRRNIASKLQLHSPAALTIYALATGLVSLDEVKASLEL